MKSMFEKMDSVDTYLIEHNQTNVKNRQCNKLNSFLNSEPLDTHIECHQKDMRWPLVFDFLVQGVPFKITFLTMGYRTSIMLFLSTNHGKIFVKYLILKKP